MRALRYAFWLFALLAALGSQLHAQSTNDSTNRFLVVDIYVDSKDKPLAAYQVEFFVTGGNAKIVGIEGGEHRAFVEPPFYDSKAMQQERVIIAAFSTNPAEKLPTGKTRVATIHLQISGKGELKFDAKLLASADPDGNRIETQAHGEVRRSK